MARQEERDDRSSFGRAPVQGSTYQRGGYDLDRMSGRNYPGSRSSRGHRYTPGPYDQAGFRPGRYRGDYEREAYYRRRDRDYGEDFDRHGYRQRDRENRVYDRDTYERESTYPYTEPWYLPGPHAGLGPEGYQRAAGQIREDVCERLTQHGRIDASDIEVRVEDDEVTLKGTVDSREVKRRAEDVAASVPGVWDVHNRLRIRRGA